MKIKLISCLILIFINSVLMAQNNNQPGREEYLKGEQARTKETWTDALNYFKLAAKKGNHEAMHALGFMYENGEGMDQDYAEAISWYRKAILKGNLDALIAIGIIFLNNDADLEAENSFKLAAEKNYMPGFEMLGYFYYSKERYEEAIPLLQKAEEKNMPMATYYLADAYENGNGVVEDATKAKILYQKAKKLGYKTASDL